MASSSFEALPLKRKTPAKPPAKRYRVYKDAREFVSVEAETAQKALEASGVAKPVRIELETLDSDTVLGEKDLTISGGENQPAPQESPKAETNAAAAETATPSAAETPAG